MFLSAGHMCSAVSPKRKTYDPSRHAYGIFNSRDIETMDFATYLYGIIPRYVTCFIPKCACRCLVKI